MTTHDNAPPPDEWRPEPRSNVYALDRRVRTDEPDIPSNIILSDN